MNFCQFCGREIPEGQSVCDCQKDANKNTVEVKEETATLSFTTPNGKIYSILAYISALFVIGLLVAPEKDDPKVKFHVGQGIILFIASLVGGIVVKILGFIPLLGTLIRIIFWVLFALLMVIGIINVCNGEDKQLPVIGQFAFYK